MCIKSNFKISEDISLLINEDCSVTINEYLNDQWDYIQISQKDAQKIAKILTEELG